MSLCPVCQKQFANLALHQKKKKPCVPPKSMASVDPGIPENVIEHEVAISGTIAAISLFSGAGGDTCGLERAGLRVVAFNEFNEAATKTHTTVFPKSRLLTNPATGKTDISKFRMPSLSLFEVAST